MRSSLLIVALVCVAAPGRCSEGVLDSKGPIALAGRQIRINSLGIMPAIVIAVTVATLAAALWLRASNKRAGHLPDFIYSGRPEPLVWSIPLMTVLLVGGRMI